MFGLLIHKPPYRRDGNWLVYRRVQGRYAPDEYVWKTICPVIR